MSGAIINALDDRLSNFEDFAALRLELRNLQRTWHPDKNRSHGEHVVSLCNRIFDHIQANWAQKVRQNSHARRLAENYQTVTARGQDRVTWILDRVR